MFTGLIQKIAEVESINSHHGDIQAIFSAEKDFVSSLKDGDSLFTHTIEGDDDMPAHIRTALTQTNLSIPIKNKKMLLGQWQGVYVFEHRYSEFCRKVKIHLIGE